MKNMNYDLVTVSRFDIVNENGYWTFLGYSIVKNNFNGTGTCFTDTELEYKYLNSDSEEELNSGDIRIESKEVDPRLWASATAGVGYLKKFMERSSFYFVEDSEYATKVEKNKQKVIGTNTKN